MTMICGSGTYKKKDLVEPRPNVETFEFVVIYNVILSFSRSFVN